MRTHDRDFLRLTEALLRRTHLSQPAELATAVNQGAQAIDAREIALYLVDFEQRALHPVPAEGLERTELSLHGTLAGRTFRASEIHQVDDEDVRRVWLPLLDGTERMGVLEIVFGREAAPLEEDEIASCERFSHMVASLVVTKNAYSDVFDRVRATKQRSIASGLLWDLVPPGVLATDDFVLGSFLEPAYDMGGDAFDFAINDGTLHFAVFDAMGHGLAAAGVATFAVAAYRHGRRAGRSLPEIWAETDAAVAAQYSTSRFVTAVIAELETQTGQLRWISAGHPAPLLLRGGRLVGTLDVAPSPPFGTQLEFTEPAAVGRASLEPGDMVLLYTDGLTEARRPGGRLFTVERLGEFIEREASNGLAAPETLRRLREAIIERGEGALRDDATAMLIEWRRQGMREAVLPQTVLT